MLISVFKTQNKIIKHVNALEVDDLELDDLLWVDLYCPTDDEKKQVEDFLQINLQTTHQAEEIESSSRYYETENLIYVNSNFFSIQDTQYHIEPVSFILKNSVLITLRNSELKSFWETLRKIETNIKSHHSGFHVLVTLFETRIDLDADVIENIAKDIANIAKKINVDKDLSEKILYEISNYQELTMLIRENIIDKQRVVSGILKSELFPSETLPKLRVMIKDIGSLLDYTTFSFERLEYLQDTFLGLINIEQNKIIKIFTVASVIFLPPTLVASIYGMNFKIIPEISWTYGYLFAWSLILVSSLGTFYFFKSRKWI